MHKLIFLALLFAIVCGESIRIEISSDGPLPSPLPDPEEAGLAFSHGVHCVAAIKKLTTPKNEIEQMHSAHCSKVAKLIFAFLEETKFHMSEDLCNIVFGRYKDKK